jgi:hypothetical protein
MPVIGENLKKTGAVIMFLDEFLGELKRSSDPAVGIYDDGLEASIPLESEKWIYERIEIGSENTEEEMMVAEEFLGKLLACSGEAAQENGRQTHRGIYPCLLRVREHIGAPEVRQWIGIFEKSQCIV